MLDVSQTAFRLRTKLLCRFPNGKAPGPGANSPAGRRAAPAIIPRHLCRFEYFPRPAGLRRQQFEAACLLRAEHKAPFLDAGSLVIRGRDGVGIWWWDAAAWASLGYNPQNPAAADIPESLCASLPDGWHHIRLENGYEARLVRQNTVIASTWRRSAFGKVEWQDVVALADADRDTAVPLPPVSDIERSQLAARVRGGTVLRRPMGAAEKGLLAGLLLASVLGGWWQGEATALAEAAARNEAEAVRLERFVAGYELFSQMRSDLEELNAAQRALGQTTPATDLATILAQIANANLSLSSMQLDREQLRLAVQTGGDIERLRSVAAQIEGLPSFVHVAAQDGDSDGEIILSAEVGP
jgi:hypothetical protein